MLREEKLNVNISGYEGPLDLLIDLSKKQRVDITKVSILELAEQYLNFVNQNLFNLKLSADYLVMASFLAYLKSKMLLPKEEEIEKIEEEFTNRLVHYNAIKLACLRLNDLPQEGRDFFVNKSKSEFYITNKLVVNATLSDLINNYVIMFKKHKKLNFQMQSLEYFSIEDGMKWLSSILKKKITEWTDIFNFFPPNINNKIMEKSATISLILASLNMVKNGDLEISQKDSFEKIYIRAK